MCIVLGYTVCGNLLPGSNGLIPLFYTARAVWNGHITKSNAGGYESGNPKGESNRIQPGAARKIAGKSTGGPSVHFIAQPAGVSYVCRLYALRRSGYVPSL